MQFSLLFRNLLFLKYYDGDVADLELDFSVVNNDLGETKVNTLQLSHKHASHIYPIHVYANIERQKKLLIWQALQAYFVKIMCYDCIEILKFP